MGWHGRYPGGAVGAVAPDPLLPGPWLVRWRDVDGTEHVSIEERNWQEDPPPQGIEINPGFIPWEDVISWTPLWDLQ